MKAVTTSVALIGVGAMAATAMGRDRSDTPIYDAVGVPITAGQGGGGYSPAGANPFYSSIGSIGDGTNDWAFNSGGTWTAATATTFPPDNFLEDDYGSVAGGPFALEKFVFVGGVGYSYGGVAFFDVYDAGGNYVDGFGVNFPQGGNFIWTITIGNPAGLVMPVNGSIQAYGYALTGYYNPVSFTWFVDADGGNIGTNVDLGGVEDGSAAETIFAYELHGYVIPAPGALALLGLAGLAGSRRRR